MIDEFSAECLIRFHRSGGGAGKREAGCISMLFQLIENLHAKGVNGIDGLVVEQMATQKGNLINQSWNRKKNKTRRGSLCCAVPAQPDRERGFCLPLKLRHENTFSALSPADLTVPGKAREIFSCRKTFIPATCTSSRSCWLIVTALIAIITWNSQIFQVST